MLTFSLSNYVNTRSLRLRKTSFELCHFATILDRWRKTPSLWNWHYIQKINLIRSWQDVNPSQRKRANVWALLQFVFTLFMSMPSTVLTTGCSVHQQHIIHQWGILCKLSWFLLKKNYRCQWITHPSKIQSKIRICRAFQPRMT